MRTTRRQVLKGVSLGASGLVLAPLVEQLAAQAAGTSGNVQRFVFVVKSSGLTPGEAVPTGMSEELLNPFGCRSFAERSRVTTTQPARSSNRWTS